MFSPHPDAWEEWALNEFFLEPACRSDRLDFIEISDEQVIEFSRADDVNEAESRFVAALGSKKHVNELLSGAALPLLRTHRPRFVRHLVFACWAQTTILRADADREFRLLLGKRLGWQVPQGLEGLAAMWEHLQTWLDHEWGIDLKLPSGGYARIGYSLGLAFPTWRDMTGLRRVRETLPHHIAGDPRAIAARIRTSINEASRSQAFLARFAEWEQAVRLGDPHVEDMSFGKVLDRIFAEKTPDGSVELFENDYGDLRLRLTTRNGDREVGEIGGDEIASLGPTVASAVRRGLVYLMPIGFGRWVAADKKAATAVMVTDRVLDLARRRKVAGGTALRRVAASHWSFALFEDRITATPHEAINLRLRRRDSIRVGGALLGRWPFTPRFEFAGHVLPTITVGDLEIAPCNNGAIVSFPPGTWSGQCRVVSGADCDSFRLLADAPVHSPTYLHVLEDTHLVPEDGILFDTQPATSSKVAPAWAGAAFPTNALMTALAEAVYAKAARRLKMQEFARLVFQAIDGVADRPNPWDIMRSFVDGGWLEPAAIRKACARTFAPRRPRLLALDADATVLIVDGLVARSQAADIQSIAAAIGVQAETRDGIGPWSLPTIVLRPATREKAGVLAARTKLNLEPDTASPSPSAERWDNPTATDLGYVQTSAWNDRRQRFDGAAREATASLRRLDRPQADTPPLYTVAIGRRVELFESPTLALLRHATVRAGTSSFERRGSLMIRAGSCVHLPAAWGRWLRSRALSAPGPVKVDGRWTYGYPVDRTAIDAMNVVCNLFGGAKRPHWSLPLEVSRRFDLPMIATAKGIIDPRVRR